MESRRARPCRSAAGAGCRGTLTPPIITHVAPPVEPRRVSAPKQAGKHLNYDKIIFTITGHDPFEWQRIRLMRNLMGRIIPTVITGAAGLIVMASSLFPVYFGGLRAPMLNIAIIIEGCAVLLGFMRLITTHARRIYRGQASVYSLGLIIAAVLTAVFLVLDHVSGDQPVSVSSFVFANIIRPMQSALGALLAIGLALAAVRMLRRQRRWTTVWFLLSALIVLITQSPLEGLPPVLTGLRSLIDAVTTGGLRGLLIGVAIGILATTFRVLLLFDRPQSE